MLTSITHDQKNDNFFLKNRLLHNQTSVVLFKQNKHHSGQEKKNKSGNPQIDHSVHDTYFNYRFSIFFLKNVIHMRQQNKKKVFFYF